MRRAQVVQIHFGIVDTGVSLLIRDHRGVTATTGKIVLQRIIIPSLQRNRPWIKTVVVQRHDLLGAFLANDDPGVAPAEVVLVPKGVQR